MFGFPVSPSVKVNEAELTEGKPLLKKFNQMI